jgi:hypothetical protein
MPKARRRSSKSTPLPPGERPGARWLLLIHQIPPKPDYLRVKIGRRLQRVGAVAIKNSVYALPAGPESYEDFQWIMREIEEGGGEAFVSEALLGDGLTDEDVRARFDVARNEEYRAILDDAKALMKAALRVTKTRGRTTKQKLETRQPALEHDLAKLRRRYESASAIDFFQASGQAAVAATLADIQDRVRMHSAEGLKRKASRPLNGATWVTRKDIHVDRIASAWLITRFIDQRPGFRFVDPARYARRDGEIRFDMFEAEYTHVGDACTFETLVSQFLPNDSALREIAEIVHDVDCKDAKFRREEAAGVARMIAGIIALSPDDKDRIEQGTTLFGNLYAAFGGKRSS